MILNQKVLRVIGDGQVCIVKNVFLAVIKMMMKKFQIVVQVAEVNGVLTHVLTAEDINNVPTVDKCDNCDLMLIAKTRGDKYEDTNK